MAPPFAGVSGRLRSVILLVCPAKGACVVSVGVVSATNRSLPKLSESENRLYADLIQTTAQINPGNSGGPLFDLHGNVIGINTAVIMPQKSINGIGFAMPINRHLLDVVNQLKQGNEIVYAYLGVVANNPSDQDRQSAGLTKSIGVRVESIQPDSPAAGGVINQNDIITAIDGHTIADSDGFVSVIGTASVVRPVSIELMRAGRAIKVQVTLFKRQLPVAAVTRDSQRLRWGGMLVGPTVSDGRSAGLMVLNIDPASPFLKRGIHEGTIIRCVAGKSVNAIDELQEIINDTPFDRCNFVTEPDPAAATASLPTGQ